MSTQTSCVMREAFRVGAWTRHIGRSTVLVRRFSLFGMAICGFRATCLDGQTVVVLMEVPTPLCFLLGAKASHPHSVPASLPRKQRFPSSFRLWGLLASLKRGDRCSRVRVTVLRFRPPLAKADGLFRKEGFALRLRTSIVFCTTRSIQKLLGLRRGGPFRHYFSCCGPTGVAKKRRVDALSSTLLCSGSAFR